MAVHMKHYFTNDALIQRYEQQIRENENTIKELLQDLEDLIQDKPAWVALARHVEETDHVSPEDVNLVHKAFADSFARIRSGKVYGVPFIWRTLPHVHTQKVVRIIQIRNTDIPSLYDKIDKRMIEIIRQLKKRTALAKDASGIALVRNTPAHSVWTIVAKKMSSRKSV